MADITVSFKIQNWTSQTVNPRKNGPAYYVLDDGIAVDNKPPKAVPSSSFGDGGTYSHKSPEITVAVAYSIPGGTHYAVFFYQNNGSSAPVVKTLFYPSRDFKLDSEFLQYVSDAYAFGAKAQHGFYLGSSYFVYKLVANDTGSGSVEFTIDGGVST
ncbi:hypothetical protein NLI96_g2247 [Meripilus lineatus]|uniref:Uncharacterized protein n=1 Tax=Meripilus lineatus TaxID=2056292 RepID=A0AAD5V8P4_9APHY|nr:hypothetical protein NLI96_g2247 [Physisporinus lineatus]